MPIETWAAIINTANNPEWQEQARALMRDRKPFKITFARPDVERALCQQWIHDYAYYIAFETTLTGLFVPIEST